MSVSLTDLERQLKAVTKTGKYIVGRKEVLGSLKGSKLVVWSASANVPPQILNECKTLQVPAIRFDGNPIELGRTCGIPYKVSVIAVKSAGDAVLSSFENSKDYSEQRSSIQVRQMKEQLGMQEGQPKATEEEKTQVIKKKKRAEPSEKPSKATKLKAAKKTRKSKEEEETEKEEGKKDLKMAKKSAKSTKKSKKKEEEDKEAEEAELVAEAEENTEEEDEE